MGMWFLTSALCNKFGDGEKDVCETNNLREEVMAEFTKGKELLAKGSCVQAIAVKKRLFELMTIPLVQGFYRYAYRLSYKLEDEGVSKTNWLSEADAFARAILPQVAMCNATVSKTIEENALYTTDILAKPMKDGYSSVKMALESTYSCLGITCKDIGAYLDKDEEGKIIGVAEGADACVDTMDEPGSSSSGVAVWVVVVVAILVGLVGGAIGYFANGGKQTGLLEKDAEMAKNNP